MHKFFEKINSSIIIKNNGILKLSDGNAAHIRDVLRIAVNDNITICDGEKGDYICPVSHVGKTGVFVRLDIDKKIINTNEPSYELTIFQALPKADKFELIIQKCVELGVFRIVPYTSERAIMKVNKPQSNSKLERWNKISESAAKQSKRGIIPEVSPVLTLLEALEYSASIEHRAVAYEKETDSSIFVKQWLKRCESRGIAVFIGPEGGFSDNEISLFIENNIMPISLGKRILRTETAPIVFAASLLYERA